MKFRVSAPIQVRFRDTDAFGHVNNAVYLSYLEMGRIHYWNEVFKINDYTKVDFILAHAKIDFRSPAYVTEKLVVFLRISRLGKKSFDCEYEVREASSNRLVAEAITTQVMFDYTKNESMLVPQEMRMKIVEFEGRENVLT